MKTIDGSTGGGQLVRTSLALAAVTDTAIQIEGIRGNRSDPGLKQQHLTGVELVADICDATVEGARPGAETLTFEPGVVRGGSYEVDVGTAGSLSLVFDTILPLATVLDDALSVTATGGTAVKWSPPLDFYEQVRLPLGRQFGLATALERGRAGYYPVGDGRATLYLWPSELSSVEFVDRGTLTGARVFSRASADLAEDDVPERQRLQAVSQLSGADIEVVESQTAISASASPGSSLVTLLTFDDAIAGFDALGEPGKPAESVAQDAVDEALAFLDVDAAVDRHSADQLLVFLALAGGQLRIPEITDHVATSLELLDAFGYEIETAEDGESVVLTSD